MLQENQNMISFCHRRGISGRSRGIIVTVIVTVIVIVFVTDEELAAGEAELQSGLEEDEDEPMSSIQVNEKKQNCQHNVDHHHHD